MKEVVWGEVGERRRGVGLLHEVGKADSWVGALPSVGGKECVCHRIRPDFTRHPDSGHVIGFASELFPSLLLSEANLRTVWPDERDFLNHSVTQMERWLRAWNLPTRLQVEWQHFFRQEWERRQHHQSTHPTGWSHSEIHTFRRYTTAVLTCPYHYHHLLRKTFIPSPTTSTPVFQPTTRYSPDQNSASRPMATPSCATIPLAYLPRTYFQNTIVIGARHARLCPTRRQAVPHSVRRWRLPFTVSFRSSSLTLQRSLMSFHFFGAFGDYCRAMTPRMTSSSTNRTSPVSSTSSHTHV